MVHGSQPMVRSLKFSKSGFDLAEVAYPRPWVWAPVPGGDSRTIEEGNLDETGFDCFDGSF